MSGSHRTQTYVGLAILCVGLLILGSVIAPRFFVADYDTAAVHDAIALGTQQAEAKPVATHIPTPEQVKTIYMSQCVVGTKDFRDSLVKIADTTEINSIIIDIKDYTGKLSFDTTHPLLVQSISNQCGTSDMREFIELLHQKGIYVIGRVTVFQDPYMVKQRPDWGVQSKSTGTVWKDYKGLSFIEVGAREYWDYVVAIATEAYAIGFDEVNFDYVRFPSDGNMDDVLYVHSVGKTKAQALEEFFAYLHEQLKDTGLVTSADLFGMTTTNNDDLNIGQVLERALPYFDYIAPMVYPSHYPKNFNGWANPNHHIYEIVHMSMARAVERGNALDTAIANAHNATTSTSTPQFTTPSWYTGGSAKKFRTWIQDFDYGGNYDVAEVKAQIQASYDAGVMSWMIWSPSNKYTRGALNRE
jgi:hypothetical protein